MSSPDHIKDITRQLIENALNDGRPQQEPHVEEEPQKPQGESKTFISDGLSQAERQSESEKLISHENVQEEPPKSTNGGKARTLDKAKPQKPQSESEKLIMDELATEKAPSEDLSEPEQSGDTESSRDMQSSERDVSETPETNEGPKDEWQDLLGSGVIMKKLLKEGQPDTKPTRSEKCFINYTCRLEEADEDTFAEKEEAFQLFLGENDVVQGLDVALGLMNVGERCLLKIQSRLAYGDKGYQPHIPKGATVIFDVELLYVQQEDEIETLTIPERQATGNKKRERGNWWYQRGENTIAIQCYRRALDYLDEVEHNEEKPSDKDLQQLLEDRLKVLNNMASAQIKMELFDQALTSLQTVLRCQPHNVKALFRKAKILVHKNELGQALKQLEMARAIEPDDPLIGKEINIIMNQISKQKNSEREYARRMFGTPNPKDTKSKSSLNLNKSKTDITEENNAQMWLVTLGISILVGVAGFLTYKNVKFP